MIYFPPSIDGFSPIYSIIGPWGDHASFGYDIVHALQPSIVVELGTERGVSYFCFCQSVRENGIEARCYAVDTWLGDKHTGNYSEQVYEQVAKHNAAHYASFSTLLRMRFEEAVSLFEDASVELLHIDGLHTYEAVQNDFKTWFPKVKPGGLVLFHDVRTRMRDFGAWRFWDEISQEYESFTFNHGFGLGVLRKPGGAPREQGLLTLLFESTQREREDLRALYVRVAEYKNLVAIERFHQHLRERMRG